MGVASYRHCIKHTDSYRKYKLVSHLPPKIDTIITFFGMLNISGKFKDDRHHRCHMANLFS